MSETKDQTEATCGGSALTAELGAAYPCAECGMRVLGDEYHPYAACLMFKGCHDSETVRANLYAVLSHGYEDAIRFVAEGA